MLNFSFSSGRWRDLALTRFTMGKLIGVFPNKNFKNFQSARVSLRARYVIGGALANILVGHFPILEVVLTFAGALKNRKTGEKSTFREIEFSRPQIIFRGRERAHSRGI